MKRMIGVCPKVFVVVEMDGQPKGMRILRTDLAANTEVFTPGISTSSSKAERKSVSSGEPVECLSRKVTVCSMEKKSYECLLSMISHSAIWMVLSILPFVE